MGIEGQSGPSCWTYNLLAPAIYWSMWDPCGHALLAPAHLELHYWPLLI